MSTNRLNTILPGFMGYFFYNSEKSDKKPSKKTPKKVNRKNLTADPLPYSLVNRRCKASIQNLKQSESRRRAAFFMLVMANTGLRYSDAVRITHADIKNRVYKFKTQKTGINQQVFFNRRVWAAYELLIERKRPKGYVFLNEHGNPISNEYINTRAKEIFVDLLSRGAHISSHSFRKTFATRLMYCSKNKIIGISSVQDCLGHSRLDHSLFYVTKQELFPKTGTRRAKFELLAPGTYERPRKKEPYNPQD